MAFSLVLSLGIEGRAQASEAPGLAAGIQEFAIPAQPLSSALSQFARQTGVAILHPRILPEDQSPGVRGRMAASDALRRLLEGTPLELAGEKSRHGRCFALRHRRAAPDSRDG